MHRSQRVGIGLVALALVTSGCYGPFNLTRRLYQWNEQAGNTKWEREFMFILLAWAPVYGLAMLGDAVVFNSMEFWTGKNPVDPPSRRGALPQQKHLARGDEEAWLTYTPVAQGARLVVEQFRHGQPAGDLHLEQRDGMTVGTDANGDVLLSAQSLPDGHVLICDRTGKRVLSY